MNADQTKDCLEIYTRNPYIMTARNTFLAIVLNTPPIITLKNMDVIAAPDLVYLSERFYVPFLHAVYDYMKTDGICPWYVERLKGTTYKVPRIPPRKSGRIRTLLGPRRHQQFEWLWEDSTNPAGNVFFEDRGQAPLLDGTLQSPISTLLNEWKLYKIMQESLELIAHRQGRQQHVVEHHPPRNIVGDDNTTPLETFGEKIAGTVMQSQERLRGDKFRVRTDALYESILSVTNANRNQKARFGIGPQLASETRGEQWERDNASSVSQAIALPPDFVYKVVPPPKLDAPFEYVTRRLDSMASAIMDVPIQMIESQSKVSANKEGVDRAVNENVKAWLRFFEDLIKRVFLASFEDTLEEKLRTDGIIDVALDQMVQVSIPVTPISADLTGLYQNEIINKETYGTHMINTMGLSEADMDLNAKYSPPEALQPQNKKPKKKP